MPFRQWRMALVCLLPAGCIFLVGTGMEVSFHQHGIFASALPSFVTNTLAILTLEWLWLSALSHNTLRQVLIFPARPNYWMYLGMFGAVELFFFFIFESLGAATENAELDSKQSAVLGLFILIAWLPFLWISLRLSIWPAAIVANNRWINPIEIWRGTRGFAWDFMMLLVIIWLPSIAVSLMTSLADYDFGGHTELVGNIVRTYSTLAFCAATLLAYYKIANERDELTGEIPSTTLP